jgi:transposase InsO family protein
MPWKERTKMQERLLFIARHEQGESISELCREYGISRKTGHKFLNRYRTVGLAGLEDHRRRPYTNPNQTKQLIVDLIIQLKQEKPHWGSAKIKELLSRRYPNIPAPARSTIHLILDRQGLIKKRNQRRIFLKAKPTGLQPSNGSNDLWCIDFKGQFRMGDKQYCYPLTVTDQHSRFLLSCEALLNTKSESVFPVFEEIFLEYGLPNRIRSDNGSPFASQGILGLSRLSVWFLRHGISLERIEPGKPQQNGAHERMHRTLKQSTTRPPENNILKQQERFDIFKKEYNYERPHEALQMKTPSEVFITPSSRKLCDLKDIEYPLHDFSTRVYCCGTVRIPGGGRQVKKVYIGSALYGEKIGFRETEEGLWEVSFMDYDIGVYDGETNQFTPLA